VFILGQVGSHTSHAAKSQSSQTLIGSSAMLGLQFPARFSLRRGSDSRRRCLPRASGEEAAEAERPAAKKKSQGISRMTVLQLKEEVRLILNFFVQNS